MSAPNLPGRMPAPTNLPGPSYAGDDYDRAGCVAMVEVTQHGYRLAIFAPNGAPMESYACVKSPRAIGRMVEEWCAGFVPRTCARLD